MAIPLFMVRYLGTPLPPWSDYWAFVIGTMIGVAAHEIGHAIVAQAVGLEPRLLRIGVGPILLRFRLGRTWVTMRAFPTSGRVTILPRPPGARAAFALFLLGGVSANAALFALLVACTMSVSAPWWMPPMAAAQIMLVAIALLPLPQWLYGRKSDGYQLLALALRRATQPAGPLTPTAREIGYQTTRPDRIDERWARRDAVAVLRDLLEQHRLEPGERAHVRASRGFALAALGRMAEAEDVVKHVLVQKADALTELICCALLARAAAERADGEAARGFMGRARQLLGALAKTVSVRLVRRFLQRTDAAIALALKLRERPQAASRIAHMLFPHE